jgi:Ankyrin repeats (3 copies)
MPKRPPTDLMFAGLVAITFLLAIAQSYGQTGAIAQKGSENELHRAARAGDLVALQARLDQGVKPDVRDSEGRTALLDAVKNGHPEIVRALLGAGASVNAATPGGRTPLIEAAENGRIQSAQLLIQAGADLNAIQRGWGSALETAERTGHLQTAALLRQAGAKTFGRSVGDAVCVRPWAGNGYCGKVESVDKMDYGIRITRLVGCENGCAARGECSAGRPVGGGDGLQVGETVATKSWCLTHTGVQQ